MDCPTKLYYGGRPYEYANKAVDNPFLEALADGGFQVGELAKYLLSEDPARDQVDISEKDYHGALEHTAKALYPDDVILQEAAFLFDDLFIRVDLLHKKGKELHLYEVKAKSWGADSDFWKTTKEGLTLQKDWLPYLQDVAFQKYVLEQAMPGYRVFAYLVLADKTIPASIEGLNQKFRVNRDGRWVKVRVTPGTVKTTLGKIPLKTLPVDQEIDWICSNELDIGLPEPLSFPDTISLLRDSYRNDTVIRIPVSKHCKRCEFLSHPEKPDLKNGFLQCWQQYTGLSETELAKPLVLQIWGGKAGAQSLPQKAIDKQKYLLEQLTEDDHRPNNFKEPARGMHPSTRRQLQIDKCRAGDTTFFLDREGLREEMAQFAPPYHFIDFETTTVAIPFHAGRKPFEGVAFQYSYHIMYEDGRVEHKSEFLALSPEFPNYQFVRALMNDLDRQPGTIFRYHNHENTFLNLIASQLRDEAPGNVPDREDLLRFIEHITHEGKTRIGDQDMVDLYELVLNYYYSPKAGGSNSLKFILPAVIADSSFIRDKYSKPIYGSSDLPSKNFKAHTWITVESGSNPYKTLPSVLAEYDNEMLDHFLPSVDEINEGGAAMMAYAYLQFSDVSPEQKELIRKALMRYCELDTMAMVMIWEFWRSEI